MRNKSYRYLYDGDILYDLKHVILHSSVSKKTYSSYCKLIDMKIYSINFVKGISTSCDFICIITLVNRGLYLLRIFFASF